MSVNFDYGVISLDKIKVEPVVGKRGKVDAKYLYINDEQLLPTKRFWQSFQMGFRMPVAAFKYFGHGEVFERICKMAPAHNINYCIERIEGQAPKLLAMSKLSAPIIKLPVLEEILDKQGYDEGSLNYANGVVSSIHQPKLAESEQIMGEGYINKFCVDVPIDGFGRPQIYLSLLRQVCSNGAVAYAPTFRTELQVGKQDAIQFSLERALESYNNEEGYDALRQRFEAAGHSWASVREAYGLHKLVLKLYNAGELVNIDKMVLGANDEVILANIKQGCMRKLTEVTGDLNEMYGLSNLDAIPEKRQRVIPARCSVYELLQVTTELATHYSSPVGSRMLNSFVGGLVSETYDMEGTIDKHKDVREFFIKDEDAAEVIRDMHSTNAH